MSKTRFKLKSRQILFVYISFLTLRILLTFCTEQDSNTAVLNANFQNELLNVVDVKGLRGFAKFQIKSVFGWIIYIVTGPWDNVTNR